MSLKPGDPAPSFEAPDQNGEMVRSSDLAGQRYLIYFYPHDDTPVCTKQAIGFEDSRQGLESLDVAVLGVSANSVGSHARFAKKYDLGFRLLADPDRRLIKDFGADGFLGRISRVSYLVGPDGRVEAVHKAELSAKSHIEWAKREVERRSGAPQAQRP